MDDPTAHAPTPGSPTPDPSTPEPSTPGSPTPGSPTPGGATSPVRREIMETLRRYGQESTRLGHAFAAHHRLQEADVRALVAIMAAEAAGRPLTPGELRRHLDVSSGGASLVIDRLEGAGHVRRSRDHSGDHRVVHLHQTESGTATGRRFFGPLAAGTDAVMDRFTPEELETVARFLAGALDAVREHLRGLGEGD